MKYAVTMVNGEHFIVNLAVNQFANSHDVFFTLVGKKFWSAKDDCGRKTIIWTDYIVSARQLEDAE